MSARPRRFAARAANDRTRGDRQGIVRGVAMCCIVLGVAALGVPGAVRWPARVVYNASDSMPRGWYRIERAPRSLPARGDVVLVRPPGAVGALAAQRGYLPAGVPLLKRVAAVAPQCVCIHGQALRVDGVAVATLRPHDAAHRPLRAWRACRRLAADELLLLGDADTASFDSRYFGPVEASAVIGIARPWRARERP